MTISLTGCGKSPADVAQITQEKEKATKEIVKQEEEKTTPEATKQVEKTNTQINKPEEKKSESNEKKDLDVKAQQTLLILDASGSMWGQIEGKAKIDIAKEVVKKTVKNFEDTELGLMAYGHRKKGDCKDIEILTPPKKDNAQNISKMVDGISPKGMTPMGASVLMAAESLKYTEQKATVILVSDGIETCDVDLCELGKKLEKTGVDFTAHVIGFDMTKKQTAGLECLAHETGGTFTLAKNADDLGKALEKTVEAASCSKEKLGEIVFDAPEKVNVNEKFKFSWTGESRRNDNIGIFERGVTNWNRHLDSITFLKSKDGKGELLSPVEAGEYDLVYFADCGTILGRKSFVVGDSKASLNVAKEVIAGSKMEVSWTGPSNHNDKIGIFESGVTNWNRHLEILTYLDSKNNKGTLNAPLDAGEYEVAYWLGGEKILAKATFSVKDATANINDISKSVKKKEKFEISWTGPNNKGDRISILPKDSNNWNRHVGSIISYIKPGQKSGKLRAPDKAGEYEVIYWLLGKKILDRKPLTVTE